MTSQITRAGSGRGSGLAADLAYAYRPVTRFNRCVRAFAASRVGSWIFARTETRLDRVLLRLTEGRASLPSLMARLPVLTLTSTGRTSGKPRETPLIAVPYHGTLALIGTNFARPNTPAWAYNLEADPRATLSYRGTSRDVVARPPTALEREEILAASTTCYQGFTNYYRRVSGRTVRIFVLEPARPSS